MRAATLYERWYGRDVPPVKRARVRAGELTAEIEGAELRYIRFGDVTLANRIYVAVRDRNWGTVPAELSDTALSVRDDSFAWTFDARHLDATLGVDLSWRGEIVGDADGTITLRFAGVANTDIEFNRIGWCILHPAENAGCRFRATTSAGPVTGALPVEIGRQLFREGRVISLVPEFDGLEIEAAEDVWIAFALEGAQFEIEDQRNWTDASFKTYSGQRSPVFPQTAHAGERLPQSARLSVASRVVPSPPREESTIKLLERTGPMPRVGVGQASHDLPLAPREVGLLKAASLSHLRVDIELSSPDWRDRLGRGADEARALHAALELAIVLDEDPADLHILAACLREEVAPVARVLAFRRNEPTSSKATVDLVREALAAEGVLVPVVGGTNVFFVDLNRSRPPLAGVDGIAWPIAATVHASDDTSVVETAQMHGETVRSARAFCGDLPLHVTPVTFNPRINHYATGPTRRPEPGELPFAVDRRQPSLLAAAWTVASLRHLAESRAASVTYFETTGWRGLIETHDGPAAPESFASWPGMVFPVYHVLADAGAFASGEVIGVDVADPLAMDALAVRKNGTLHLLIASFSPARQLCRVEGIFAGVATMRVLDDQSFDAACSDPSGFRGSTVEIAVDGPLSIELTPYSVVRLDVAA
jgi:hypothetical protein